MSRSQLVILWSELPVVFHKDHVSRSSQTVSKRHRRGNQMSMGKWVKWCSTIGAAGDEDDGVVVLNEAISKCKIKSCPEPEGAASMWRRQKRGSISADGGLTVGDGPMQQWLWTLSDTNIEDPPEREGWETSSRGRILGGEDKNSQDVSPSLGLRDPSRSQVWLRWSLSRHKGPVEMTSKDQRLEEKDQEWRQEKEVETDSCMFHVLWHS